MVSLGAVWFDGGSMEYIGWSYRIGCVESVKFKLETLWLVVSGWKDSGLLDWATLIGE